MNLPKGLTMPLLSRTFAHVATHPHADINAVIDESHRRLERAKAALQIIARTMLESLRVLETTERKLRDLEARPAMIFRLDRQVPVMAGPLTLSVPTRTEEVPDLSQSGRVHDRQQLGLDG